MLTPASNATLLKIRLWSNKVRTVSILCITDERLLSSIARVFEAYFGEDRDISRDDVLRAIVGEVGLDPAAYFAAIAAPSYKDRLRANTEECVHRGGFGSPTFFVGDDMYFGNDRLVLVEAALVGGRRSF